MNSKLPISIIIPAYNAADTLPACLKALKTQTVPPESYEIIVIDDGSSDETAEIARSAGVRVVSQANGGAAMARNHGAEVAQGQLLLFTDADCLPAPDWIERLSAPFADPTVVGAKGVYQTKQTALPPRFVQQEYEDKYDRMRPLTQIDFVDTYSAAYRRDVFLQMGGFDTSFPGASVEDQEFSFRLAEAGHKLVFVPTAVVSHRHDPSLAEYARRKYYIGYWKTIVLKRYPGKLANDSHTPQTLKLQMGLAGLGGFFALLTLLTRKFWWVWATLGAWMLLIISGGPLYQKIWRKDRPVLLIAPLMLFIRAWALGLGLVAGIIRLIISEQFKSDGY